MKKFKLYSYGATRLKTGEDFVLYKVTDFLKIASLSETNSIDLFDKVYDLYMQSTDEMEITICEMGKFVVDIID